MEWTKEKKKELVTALTIIQNVCRQNVPHCEHCPLRALEGHCTLWCDRPDQWNIDTAEPEAWRVFK